MKPTALLTAATLFAAHSASAASKWWDTNGTTTGLQPGTGTWDTGTTSAWSTALAGTALTTWADGDAALFLTTGTNAVTVNGTILAASLTNGTGTAAPSTATTLNNGTAGILQLTSNAGIVSNGNNNSGVNTLTINTGVRLASSNVTFAIGAGTVTTVGGAIDETGGARALFKDFGGTLNLNGANTWTGGTTVNSGLLRFGTGSTIPATGTIAINSAGALAASGPAGFTTINQWLDSGKITAASSGALTFNTATNNETIDLSVAHTGNTYNSLYLGTSSSTGATTYSGALTPGSNGYLLGRVGTLTVSSALNAATSLTVGATGTLVLTNTNGYTGVTNIGSGGQLRISNAGALGTTGSGVDVASGGNLQLSGNIAVTGESITIRGVGSPSTSQGALNNQSGDNSWAGNVLIGADLARIGVNTGTINVIGVIDDGANTYNLAIRNSSGTNGGAVILSGANTYGGRTDVVVGTLRLGADNTLPFTGMRIGNGSGAGTSATLDLNGHSQTLTSISSVDGTVGNNITARVISGVAGGALTLNVTTAFSTQGTGTANQGVILGGAGSGNDFSINKTGAETATFTSANTYSGGTTITNGTISLTVGTGSAAAVGGGTLGTGDVTVLGTAISLSIGMGVTDAIADTATLMLAGGGGVGADFGYANLASGVNETVNMLFLGGLMQGAGIYGSTSSGAQFQNNEYFSGLGTVTVLVPEPSSALMLLCGAGLLGLRRRR